MWFLSTDIALNVSIITLTGTGDIVRGYNTTWDVSFDVTNQETTGAIQQANITDTNFDVSVYLAASDYSSTTANSDGTSVVAGETHSYRQTADISTAQLQQALAAGDTMTVTGQVGL